MIGDVCPSNVFRLAAGSDVRLLHHVSIYPAVPLGGTREMELKTFKR